MGMLTSENTNNKAKKKQRLLVKQKWFLNWIQSVRILLVLKLWLVKIESFTIDQKKSKNQPDKVKLCLTYV